MSSMVLLHTHVVAALCFEKLNFSLSWNMEIMCDIAIKKFYLLFLVILL